MDSQQDIDSRLAEAERLFDECNAQREQHLKEAEQLLVRMHELRGEYRALEQMKPILSSHKEKKDNGKSRTRSGDTE